MADTININTCEDEEKLHTLLNKTDNMDERKKIRTKLKEIRDRETAAIEARRQANQASSSGESAIEMKLRQAEQKKQQQLRLLEEAAKEKREKTDIGAGEQAIRERHARAEAGKQRQMEQAKEMSNVYSQMYHEGTDRAVKDNVKAADDSRAKQMADYEEESVLRATRTEKGDDGSTTTTTTTTSTQRSKGRGGARSAMSAFKQMDKATAPPGGGRPNYLSTGGGGGRGRGGGVGVQRSPSTIKQMLLDWCRAMTKEYTTIEIRNFSSSWNDGLAFCALIHHFYPDAFDFYQLDPKNRRQNFQLGFDTAEKLADICPLLEVEDMVRFKNPDWKCVFTYVQSFYRRFRMTDQNAQTPTTPTGTATPTSPEPQSTEVAKE